jgi:large subunit ribosomal protein L17e
MSTKYAYESEESAVTAMARIDGINASFKDLANVCGNVRGRRADKALVFLTEASEKKRPVRYFNYNKRRGHVSELGGKKGGWPAKSCKIVRDVLINAIANAKSKGMGECKITHIQANKQLVYGRMSPKGRRIRHDLETAFVEIVLRELQMPAGKESKPAAGKKTESKTSTPSSAVKESKPAAASAPAKTETKPVAAVATTPAPSIPMKTETPKTAVAEPAKN